MPPKLPMTARIPGTHPSHLQSAQLKTKSAPRNPRIQHAPRSPKPNVSPRFSPSSHQPPPPPPHKPFFRMPRPSTLFFLACLGLTFRDHILVLDTVHGASMSPTLSPSVHETGVKDTVLIDRRVWRLKNTSALQRGDVITLWKPHRPEELSIKRVVALEGDTVFPTRGYAVEGREGKRLGLNDGLPEEGEDKDTVEDGGVVVPHGHVWVEGDNWRKSFDSNDFGPVSKGLIDGKAVAIWRNWFEWRGVGDEREKRRGSRVVEGTSKLPDVFVG